MRLPLAQQAKLITALSGGKAVRNSKAGHQAAVGLPPGQVTLKSRFGHRRWGLARAGLRGRRRCRPIASTK
jgi:hypothetical protein